MSQQLSFLDAPPATPSPDPKHLARREGPQSSREAAKAIVRSGGLKTQCDVIHKALLRFPDVTGAELAQLAGLDLQRLRRRLSTLVDEKRAIRGPERKCTVTNRLSLTWRAIGG